MRLYQKTTYFLLFLSFFGMATPIMAQPEMTSSSLLQMKQDLIGLATDLHLPGFSAGIVYQDSLIWSASYGWADIENNIPASTETMYSLASISKPFASIIALRLDAENLIDLDAPVAPLIDPILKHYGIPVDESVGSITLRHLLSHTSSAPTGLWYQYDGDRYALISHILEKSTGMPYDQLVQKVVIEPAGMQHTCPIDKITHQEFQNKLSAPYRYDTAGHFLPGNYTNQCNSATGWVSSVEDLSLFTMALNQNILMPELLKQETFTPFQMKSGAKSPYGLGWFVERIDGVDVIWHNGFGYCTSGLLIMIPEKELTFIMLTNSDWLSRPFSIGLPGVSVMESPFALVFLEKVGKRKSEKGGKGESGPVGQWANGRMDEVRGAELKGLWNVARVNGDSAKQDSLMKLYEERDESRGLLDMPGENKIASLTTISRKDHHLQSFSLSDDTLIHIVAVADGGYSPHQGMYDQVYITDSVSGEVIWKMNSIHTTNAGGHPRNRLANLVLPIESGSYILHFDNSDSPYNHFPDHWEAFPPPDECWGAVVALPMTEFEALEARIQTNAEHENYAQNQSLFETGHRKGYFFLLHPALPQCQPYKQFSWFDSISATDLALREQALEKAKTTYILQYPEGYDPSKRYPLLMVFHGGGMDANKARMHWQSKRLSEHFIVVYLQSFRHYTSNSFGWRAGDLRDRQEVQNCYAQISKESFVDPTQIVLGGISAGASMAADLFVNQIIPATSLIAISPQMPEADQTPHRDRSTHLKATIVIGMKDAPQRIAASESLAKWCQEHNIPCRLEKIENMGHAYPEDFSKHLDTWLP